MNPYYEESGITIYHGDCREVLPTLAKVDLVLTDPPYGIGWRRGEHRGSRGGRNKSNRASKAHDGIVGDADTSLRDHVIAALNSPGIYFGSFYAPFPAHLKQVLVWEKSADSGVIASVTGFRRDVEPIFLVGPWPLAIAKRGSVFRTPRSQSHICTETGHPHTKPTELLTALLEFAPDGTILDPFLGSGSTLVAAKRLGRMAIGIEIEERYCEVAVGRLRQSVLDFGHIPALAFSDNQACNEPK